MLKKSFTIIGLIIYFSIILTTSSPFQNNNLFEDNTISFVTNNTEFVYAEEENGGDDKGDDEKNDKDVDEEKDASFADSSNDNNGDNGNNNDNEAKENDKDVDKGGTDDGGKSNDDRDEVTETSSASFSSSDDSSPPDGNPSSSKDSEDFKKKVKNEVKVVTKKISKNKVVVRDYDNKEKEVIIVSNKNKCPTQSGSVGLTGTISPNGIRLLADFDPCKIKDGSVTLNMPNTQNIKLAAVYIDKKGNNHAGTLINPSKIQDINKKQGLFTIGLDEKMKGINPITKQTNTLTKINALLLYNIGEKPIQFKSGNTVVLTAILTK
jgi:hypothetical protein